MDNNGFTDAASILATFPRIGNKNYAYGFSYGLTWNQGNPGSTLQPNELIGLTVAGLHRAGALDYVKLFLRVLAMSCEKLRTFVPNPQQAVTLELTSTEVYEALSNDQKVLLAPQELYALLEHEPAMWSGGRGMTLEGDWRWEVTRPFRRYENVRTVDDYLEALTALIEVHTQRVAQAVPFSVPKPLESGIAGIDGYRAEADQIQLQPEIPLLGSGIDFELWEHVRPLVEAGRWEQVAREAAIFVETQARLWTGGQFDGLELMSQLLKPKKAHGDEENDRKREANEAEGWHLLALGFFKAVRNHVVHNTVGTEEQLQYGLGTLGTASLLIRRIRTIVEIERVDADRSNSASS
jgi:uncharacterized protein (TIGR02391 family)